MQIDSALDFEDDEDNWAGMDSTMQTGFNREMNITSMISHGSRNFPYSTTRKMFKKERIEMKRDYDGTEHPLKLARNPSSTFRLTEFQ